MKAAVLCGLLAFALIAGPAAAAGDPTGQQGSGGRAVVHRAGGEQIHSAALEARAPDARLFRSGHDAVEPTMGITKRGSVFFAAVGRDPQLKFARPDVLRTNDQGASFKDVSPRVNGQNVHASTEDPYVYVDPVTSRVFTDDLIEPCHVVSFSDDEGEHWTNPPPAGCGFNSDHQNLFAGPPVTSHPQGYPNVVYLCSIGAGASVLAAASVCSKSLDGGTSFAPTGSPAYTGDPRTPGDLGIPGLCQGTIGHGFVGPDGTLYVPKGYCGQPYLAVSHDEGDTWQRVQVADNGMGCCLSAGGPDPERNGFSDHEAGVVADAAGNVYYDWVARNRLPYLAISHDRGKTWSKPLMIGAPGVRESVLPGIAIGGQGRIAMVYMGSQNSPWNGERPEREYTDAVTWGQYVTVTVDALAADPVFYSASINDPADPLIRGSCGPVQCGSEGEIIDVQVAPDGTPWSSAADGCKGTTCGSSEGILGRLVGGPSLVGGEGAQRPGVSLPPGSSRRCRSRRSFVIHLRQPRRGRIRTARVYVNGKRVKVLQGRRLRGRRPRARIDLRGLGKGRYTVRVVVRTTTGRTLARTRHYRTCTRGAHR